MGEYIRLKIVTAARLRLRPLLRSSEKTLVEAWRAARGERRARGCSVGMVLVGGRKAERALGVRRRRENMVDWMGEVGGRMVEMVEVGGSPQIRMT